MFSDSSCKFSQSESKFKELVNQFSSGAPFQQVTYPAHCGALCRASTLADDLHLQASVMEELADLARCAAVKHKHANVAAADVVIIFEVWGNNSVVPCKIEFAALGNASGRCGRFLAHTDIVCLDVVGNCASVAYPYADLNVRHSRDEYVAATSHQIQPLAQSNVGRLRSMSDDVFTAELIKLRTGDCDFATRVVVMQAKYTCDEGCFDSYQIVGVDDHVGRRVVTSGRWTQVSGGNITPIADGSSDTVGKHGARCNAGSLATEGIANG